MPDDITPPSNTKSRMSFSLDYRIIVVLLLVVIGVLLALCRPWASRVTTSNDRTISVSGNAKISAEPDEYTFNPSYEFKDADKTAALTALTKKSDELISKLKGLGVPDSSIKTGASGYDTYQYYYDPGSRTNTYTLQLTIKTTTRDLAQKVQDYLVNTTPIGAVSPQITFSENKRKDLESQARDKATKEARAKADQSAKNLGFKVGNVKSVDDGTGFNNPNIYDRSGVSKALSPDSATAQLNVQPGQNDLDYTVNVVYYLR